MKPNITKLYSETVKLLSGRKEAFSVTKTFLELASETMHFDQMLVHDTSNEPPFIILAYPDLKNKEETLNYCLVDALASYIETDIDTGKHYYFALKNFGVLEGYSGISLSDNEIERFINILEMVNNYVALLRYMENLDTYTDRLEKMNNLLNSLIDSMPDLIAYKDTNERYRLVNKAARFYYKNVSGDIVGKTINDIYNEKDANIVRQLDSEVTNEHKTIRKTIDIATDNGYKTVDSIRTPVINKNNELEGIITISRDLENIQKAKKALESKERFQSLLMRISTNYINVETSQLNKAIDEALKLVGEFIDADRAYVFKYDFDKGLTHNTHEWVNEGVTPQIHNLQNQPIDDFFSEWVESHLRGETIFYQNIERELDHESIIYEILSMQSIKSLITVPLMSQSKCIGFAGFDDVRHTRYWEEQDRELLNVLAEIITNLFRKKEREESIEKIKQSAIEANNQKSNYLSSLSHEIRTPLSSLSNALELINTDSLDQSSKKNVSIARTSLNMVNSLVGNALDRSRIEAGILDFNREEVELDTLLFEILQSQNLLAIDKGNRLKLSCDASIKHTVLTDSSRLRQVLLNLINNAVKFTDNGIVSVNVHKSDETDNAYNLVFSVTDTGIGMKESVLETMSQKYQSIANENPSHYEGMGLGIPIVHEIIELMGSTLKVESKPEKGSRFEFTLTLEKGKKLPFSKALDNHKDNVLILYESLDMLKEVEYLLQDSNTNATASDLKKSMIDEYGYDSVILALELKSTFSNDFFHNVIRTHHLKGSNIILFKQNNMRIDLNEKTADMVDECIETFIPRRLFEKALETVDANHGNIGSSLEPLEGTVLVVEDNPLNLETMSELLMRFGLKVEQSKDGYEAIHKLQNTTFDIIIADYQMPGLNGMEFANIARNEYGIDAPFVILSAHPFKEDITVNEASPITNVLIKPIDSKELYRILAQILNDCKVSFTQIESILKSIPTFNEKAFEKRFESFEGIGKKVLTVYVNQWTDYLDEVKRTLENRNYEDLAKTMHYLKGAFEYLSADRLAVLSDYVLERAINKQNLTIEEDILYDRFKKEFERFNLSIKNTIITP